MTQTPIPVATLAALPGKQIAEVRGLARGCSTRSAMLSDDLVATMKNVVGGEIPEYTKIMAESREEALDRMVEHALSMGANAVLAVRFCTTEIAGGAAEMMAYGTAVILH